MKIKAEQIEQEIDLDQMELGLRELEITEIKTEQADLIRAGILSHRQLAKGEDLDLDLDEGNFDDVNFDAIDLEEIEFDEADLIEEISSLSDILITSRTRH